MWTFYNSNGEALVQHAESEATQAEMEAETAVVKFVPPDLVRHSPGVAKAWVKWEQTGDHSRLDSYNVSSVTDGGGAGDTDHLWDDDFASAPTVVGMAPTSYAIGFDAGAGAPSTTGVTTVPFDTSNQNATDRGINCIAAFGDQ